jgi:hypothetical protein
LYISPIKSKKLKMTEAEKKKLKRFGLTKLNKPKRTPKHPKKKGIVATRVNGKVKVIRFGDQNMGHNYSAEARKSFKSRHAKNIKKGRSSAAFWADKFFWSKGGSKKRPPKSQKIVKGIRRR